MSACGTSATLKRRGAMSISEPILLQNDFGRPATKFLIQGFNGRRKIDSTSGLL
jgi:hypothetical protein